jgi:adenosine deaminase
MRLRKLFLFLILLSCYSLTYADVNDYFESIKADPNALYTFLKTMPKGGELHYHLSGGAYPETMLALASQGDYCLDKVTWGISKTTKHCLGVKSRELLQQPALYNQVIRAWSMKDFVPGDESGSDHFFASFYKFMPLVSAYRPQLLAEIMQRAANQHEQYLEIMILPDNARSTTFAPQGLTVKNFREKSQLLLTNQAFQDNIKYTIDVARELLQKARQSLNCEQNPIQDVCQLTVKFQYYVLREQSVEKLFAQTLNAFAAVSQSQELVAVNLVQDESALISLQNYHKQMEIFAFMHQLYPKVHISLHAGELAPEAVLPKDLRSHIHEAVVLAQAERIGHGVDIAFENKAITLLKTMADKQIAVEIALTSNKKLLNVAGKRHPLRFYLAHEVPVVLSTDDEGILRTDLTRQYVEAVFNHGLDYSTLKVINRNALTYSFLPGSSLWANAATAKPIAACQHLNSPACLEFVKMNEKARLQLQLENKLAAFEKNHVPSYNYR